MVKKSPILLSVVALLGMLGMLLLYIWGNEMRRRALTAEISKKALVAGTLEYVVFDPKQESETVSRVVAQLAAHHEPRNGLILNDRELDRGLKENLGQMTWLQQLNLVRTNMTDEDLSRLTRLKKLYSLTLTETPITDAGLKHLGALTSLQELNISGTQVTDAGLLHLTNLTWLRILDVSYTHVTEKGLIELKKKLPDFQLDYALADIRRANKQPRQAQSDD
jgi:Leucine-rich repeat (LRR) protein